MRPAEATERIIIALLGPILWDCLDEDAQNQLRLAVREIVDAVWADALEEGSQDGFRQGGGGQ